MIEMERPPMTDIEKIEAEIQQLFAMIASDYDSILPDLIAEKVKEYGELRDDAGYDRGWSAGQDSMRAWG